MIRLLLPFLLLAWGGPALADTLRLAAPHPLPALPELRVDGFNAGGTTARVVLRADDRSAPPYADRANIERLVPPGPFTLRLRLPLLTTPAGRAIEPERLRQVIAHSPDSRVRLERIAIEGAPALPEGAFGWSFAPPGAAPLAGMQAVSPEDPALQGNAPRFVRRPGEDPILARGMNGVTRFEAPLPSGRWIISLWTEDAGEWETLPAVLEQRIRINGRDVMLFRRDEEAWRRARYLEGRDTPETATPFAALGARRGGRVEAEIVLAPGEPLVVELAGHPRAATHLAALTVAPDGRARDAIEALREARFAEAWPVLSRPAPARTPSLRIAAPAPVVTAPGAVLPLRFTLTGPGPMPLQAELGWEGPPLPARLLWGHWRWRRPAPETPGLVLSAAHLRADMEALTLPDGLPRELVALVEVPRGTRAGRHRLRLAVNGAVAQVEVEVLAVHRPTPPARVGVFLDHSPALGPDAANRQAACDLATLRQLGFTLLAPALATPDDDAGMARLLEDLAGAQGSGPIIAYTPLRRLAAQLPPAQAAERLRAAEHAIAAAGLPQPFWVVADEPSAHGGADAARTLARTLRIAGSEAQLAAHLNDPRDAALLPLLSLVTVNPRFGADAADIAALRAAGVRPFLYNMPSLRVAAGFHLWRSSAEGLLQWHARMPTADPFDPTDGREGDVQFLWPQAGICTPPDLDADLLSLLEGIEDLRWLAWLDAAPGPQAAALRARMRREVPATWAGAAALPPATLDSWQDAIRALARHVR